MLEIKPYWCPTKPTKCQPNDEIKPLDAVVKIFFQFKTGCSTIFSTVYSIFQFHEKKSKGFEKKLRIVQTDAIKYFNIPSILKLLLRLLNIWFIVPLLTQNHFYLVR